MQDEYEQTQGKKPVATNAHSDLNHVGGISDELGGVDPRADENLIRLSGGN
ncbi:hypothetical protein [Acetonema longum]|uniref:Uncharacterized protein n=1 Tax=Acetonema longum DSM 6540 TaxID=1009370 RepID=F7NJE8_9FIRM|nr:hypothetical protein [Acetonema longum]EGO63896.1 hypothetical protein ALO_11019 [Acetonema longum DSM 6540]